METLERPARKIYLDWIRILASFGVVYNHAFVYEFFERAGVDGVAAQFAFFLCKTAVPLFFMISGVLLLPRVDSYRKVGTRILRILLVLLVMGAFYCVMNSILAGEPFTVRELVYAVFRDQPMVYWFLYSYLGLLVMLPILQRMTCSMTKRDFRYVLLVTAIAAGILPIVRHLGGLPLLPMNLNASIFYPYIGMALLGLYIDRYCDVGRGGMIAAGCGWLLFTAASVLLTRLDPNPYLPTGNLFADDRTLLPIVGASASLFYLCKGLAQTVRLSERAQAWTAALGRRTFGVYLVFSFFLFRMYPLSEKLTPVLGEYWGTFAFALAVWLCAYLLTTVMTYVPGLKKLL